MQATIYKSGCAAEAEKNADLATEHATSTRQLQLNKDAAQMPALLAKMREAMRSMELSNKRLHVWENLCLHDPSQMLLCDGVFDARVDEIVEKLVRLGHANVPVVVQAAVNLTEAIVETDDLPAAEVPAARHDALCSLVGFGLLQ